MSESNRWPKVPMTSWMGTPGGCAAIIICYIILFIYVQKKKALNVRSQLKNQKLGEKVYTEVLMSFGEGNSNPFPYSCLEKFHRQSSLVGHGPCGRRESDTTEVTEHARSYVIIFSLPIIKYFYQMIIWRKSHLRHKS